MSKLQRVLVIAGGGLIVLSLVILIYWYGSASLFAARCEEYVSGIQDVLPAVKPAAPQQGKDNTMPVLAVDDVDFVALLEFPANNGILPVANNWGNVLEHPCRFTGSVHEDALVIGATDRKGHCDFVGSISVGDAIFVTDMMGNRYSYRVSDILHSDNAYRDLLMDTDAPLTIFVKNTLSDEYILIRCTLSA